MADATLPPGTVLIGRFSLEDLVEYDDGAAVWRARDLTLRRSVAVRTIASDDPRAQALLEAARASAPIVDPRILRVLDTDHDQGLTFSVHEWVSGESLEDTVRHRHLDPVDAARLLREVADAIADAHRVGVSHGGLSPGKVLRRADGEVRIIGVGVDRALHPRSEQQLDPQAEDVREIGALLFTALAGRSPADSGEVSPARVRAGVPRSLDDLCSTLLTRTSLSARQVRDRLDRFLEEHEAHRPPRARSDDLHLPARDTPAPLTVRTGPAESARWLRLAGIVAAAVLLLVAVAVALSSNLPKALDPTPSTTASSEPTSAAPSGEPLSIAALSDYDPLQNGPVKEEHPEEVPLAVDGDPSTAWTTQTYFNDPHLGRLKEGVGLLIDLGSDQQVSQVTLTLVGEPTDVSLLAAPGAAVAPSLPSDFTVVADIEGAGTSVALTPTSPVTTRFLVVWLTSLPEVRGGFRGAIAEITVTP